MLSGTHRSEGALQKVGSLEDVACDNIKQTHGVSLRHLPVGQDEEAETGSLKWTGFNYVNSVLGSGLIGIPFALHEAGFGLGMLLLVAVAGITDYSLVLMVRSAHLCGRFTYQGIMEAAFGRPGYVLLSALQAGYPFVTMVSYNVIVGDTVPKVLVRLTGCSSDALLARREVVVLVAMLLIVVPLCLHHDIARLAKISFVSLLCLLFILFAVLLRVGPMRKLVPPHADSWRFANWGIAPAIGIMAFAFMCHHNTFLLYASIEDATQRKWERVTHAAIGTSAAAAAVFGVAGYATFAAHAQGDLLENYCWDDDLMNACRLLFAVQILLTFPIECFVSRQVVELAVPLSKRAHHVVTLAIVGAAYAISMATDCLSVVLALNGALAAVPLAYLLPAAVYLRLEAGSVLTRPKWPALLVLLFGVAVAALGALFLLGDLAAVDTCSHGQAMAYCRVGPNATLQV